MILEMLRWWYVTGWLQAVRRIATMTQNTSRTFSMPLLLQTLFAPWRRIVSMPGRSFDAKLRAALDNFVSRCVGFMVRILVLLAAGAATIGSLAAGLALAILWPVLPLAFVYLLVRGITG